ncbi:MAG TPA: hypothetical protein VGL91_06130 [Acidobacteriota bacterium]|jgi:hypothetical protein
MKHFSLGDWADFARQSALPDQKIFMRRHLDGGCEECLKVSELWRSIWEIGKKEASYKPPESALRAVRAAYAASRRFRTLPKSARIARLMFDSFREAAPVGLRSSMSGARHTLHKAGQFLIDMCMESEPGSSRISLAGQILNPDAPGKGLHNLGVLLVCQGKLLARAATNRFGEFHLEFDPGAKYRIFVEIPRQKAIVVSLPALGGEVS